MSNTKIVVIKRRQLLYTLVLILLLVIVLLFLIFMPRKGSSLNTNSPQYENNAAKYNAGVYTCVITLNNNLLNMEVVVDKNHINSVRISNLDEAVTTMYPLVAPALEKLAEQLYLDVDFDAIKLSEESKHTQTLLLDAIKATIAKAEIVSSETE